MSKKPICFIVMPFKDPYNKYYEDIIRPAIQSMDVLPLRGDEIYKPAPIINDIWKSISESEFVVAEMTGRSPNVLYEIGLAHALQKPVIMITENPRDIPFDLRHIRCITYDINESNWSQKLGDDLVKTIETTLREGLELRSQLLPSKLRNVMFGGVLYKLNEVAVKFNLREKSYHLMFHKMVKNTAEEPITRVLFHVLVNKFPDDPKKSFEYYQKNPLKWEAIDFKAWDKSGSLDSELVNDFNSRKDYFIMFSTRGVQRPILQNEEREFWYSYEIAQRQWGPYIDRPITFPTERCVVNLMVPVGDVISVGGSQMSPFREYALPLNIEKTKSDDGKSTIYRWEENNVLLGSTYQINWSPLNGSILRSTKISTSDQRLAKQV